MGGGALWPESSLPPGAGPQDSQGTAVSLSKQFWTMWAQSHDLAILGASEKERRGPGPEQMVGLMEVYIQQ